MADLTRCTGLLPAVSITARCEATRMPITGTNAAPQEVANYELRRFISISVARS